MLVSYAAYGRETAFRRQIREEAIAQLATQSMTTASTAAGGKP
jgi:hypothetical protein